MKIKNMLIQLKKKQDTMTRPEIKEAIIELNHYMLTAIDIHDKISILEIREQITELINLYLNKPE